ncbi:N-acetylneuraminate synthase family protein [Glaciecola sp. 33A]|jgi:sialic acid synthase SpsE/endonuclease IV|uniref:N-acetylneuraminate synthase family protein n=1 Tax=Glaciecola sp. 33A TaxID=2057807 RepID=UPI000C34B7D5|nr:N-acetylneuraminate synthase family protein [Glaciecola sp. 33A]PKI02290.1 acetylneuraminic acid synthetase [Glaciecola sp. 33A]
MLVTKNIQQYICFSESNLIDVLKKINENKARVIFVVSEHGKLQGSISDGDVRRWLTATKELDLNVLAKTIMNPNVKKLSVGANQAVVDKVFLEGIDCIPLVDESDHLIQLAFQKKSGFFVKNREISESSPSFIIAEIGNNHQGDINLAKKLVDHAVAADVDCVKFQMRNMKNLYKDSGKNDVAADLGAQYTLDLLSKFQLSNDELIEVFNYAKSKGVLPLCTPWDIESLKTLENYGMEAYKVASADFTNFELLEAIVNTGKPFFCSTGMSSESEIKETVEFLGGSGANYVLLHCNSTYPTPFKDVNLKYITRLKEITGALVGYSGHERGICVPIAAIALGATVIEKHLTTDTKLEGTDHKVSLLPNELNEMVKQIRQVEEGLGSSEKPREITQGELMNRENLAKSLVAVRDVMPGEIITRDMVEIKSPGQGLQPNRLNDLIGKKVDREIVSGGFYYMSDILGQIKKRNYHFNRPFGVPVRYHDYRQILDGTNLDFVEFHLSYNDMKIDLKDYFSGDENIGFAVHSPELFANDHILDLCADEPQYLAQSKVMLQEVVNITRELNQYFPKTKDPVIVVNAGGWNNNGFIDEKFKDGKYQAISNALSDLDLEDVTIAIQTMPPFPWHFGGQSYHNLFVCADEIVTFCKNNPKIKICLDISHSMMSCNYYGWDLLEFVQKVAPYNVHLHIVDAKGVDGEGIEIGKGDVDFPSLMRLLDKENINVQFIPEVWQGHKNGGEGFWAALEYLEKIK